MPFQAKYPVSVEKIKSCIAEKKEYFDVFEKKIFENKEKDIIVIELYTI